MAQPKILLAGMNRYPNQFSRKIEQLGCETVPLSGDPGGHIPTDCEAVIITKCQSSHEKFYQVKDAYKALNKPVFITDFGFSPIKERFTEFLKKLPRPAEVKSRGQSNAMSHAFFHAANLTIDGSGGSNREEGRPQGGPVNAVPSIPKEEVKMTKKKTGPKTGSTRAVHSQEVTNRVNQIVQECYDADMSTRETLQMIQAEGFKMADGRDYTTAYISTIRYRMGLRPKGSKMAHRAPEPVAAPARRVHTPVDQSSPLELIGRVLATEVSLQRKLELVAKIQSGEITTDSAVTTKVGPDGLQLMATSIIDGSEKKILTLNKVQAIAVAQAMKAIETYISKN